MSDSDDEEIKAAIALSLGQADARKDSIIVLSDSDEDTPSVSSIASIAPATLHAKQSNNPSGMVGIDRKAMEAERLARKRKAACISPPPEATKHAKASLSSPSTFSFAEPTVKKTICPGQPRLGDDIKLSELLSPPPRMAILSSFQWDIPWLLSTHISLEKTKTTLVMQAKDEATKQQYRRETSGQKNLRLCFPSMEGQINCMHSKLMLLSFERFLRIVVPTGNLVQYDWGEGPAGGGMENSVFVMDLPRSEEGKRVNREDLTLFGRELLYFLMKQGLDGTIVDSLLTFDFGETRKLGFVHTIGGAHGGDSWKRTGHCGLGSAITELGLATSERLMIDFVTSSVGSLTTDFISTFHLACQGSNGHSEYSKRNSGAKATSKITAEQRLPSTLDDSFRIYFPTADTIAASKTGYAGTICMQRSYYESGKFPRQLLRDCKSVRERVLMHNKIVFVRPEKGRAWAYLGSANCSESAWGSRLVKDRGTKSPKLNCRNWECGVVIPAGMVVDQPGLDVFRGVVPVPMQFPSTVYGNRQPWYFQEQN